MPARKPKTDEKPQSERFIETALEIGADETAEAFERVFAQIAKPKPALSLRDKASNGHLPEKRRE